MEEKTLDEKIDKKDVDIVGNDEDKEKSLAKDIIETVVYFLICFAIIICIKAFVIQHVKVDGSSMYPTLHDEEHLLVEKISYMKHDVERYDIIVFNPHGEKSDVYFIKRVIGLPNETLWIKDGKIHIKDADGKEEVLDEHYGKGITEGFDASKEIHIGKDEYFVLGDNRQESRDSRDSATVGLVSKDSIMGRAWKRIYPFDKFGSIEDKKND